MAKFYIEIDTEKDVIQQIFNQMALKIGKLENRNEYLTMALATDLELKKHREFEATLKCDELPF